MPGPSRNPLGNVDVKTSDIAVEIIDRPQSRAWKLFSILEIEGDPQSMENIIKDFESHYFV